MDWWPCPLRRRKRGERSDYKATSSCPDASPMVMVVIRIFESGEVAGEGDYYH
jgi:hypothetical protein